MHTGHHHSHKQIVSLTLGRKVSVCYDEQTAHNKFHSVFSFELVAVGSEQDKKRGARFLALFVY